MTLLIGYGLFTETQSLDEFLRSGSQLTPGTTLIIRQPQDMEPLMTVEVVSQQPYFGKAKRRYQRKYPIKIRLMFAARILKENLIKLRTDRRYLGVDLEETDEVEITASLGKKPSVRVVRRPPV